MTEKVLAAVFRLILFERGDFHTIKGYFDGEHNFERDLARLERWVKWLKKGLG